MEKREKKRKKRKKRKKKRVKSKKVCFCIGNMCIWVFSMISRVFHGDYFLIFLGFC